MRAPTVAEQLIIRILVEDLGIPEVLKVVAQVAQHTPDLVGLSFREGARDDHAGERVGRQCLDLAENVRELLARARRG